VGQSHGPDRPTGRALTDGGLGESTQAIGWGRHFARVPASGLRASDGPGRPRRRQAMVVGGSRGQWPSTVIPELEAAPCERASAKFRRAPSYQANQIHDRPRAEPRVIEALRRLG